jgi:hypothetical protein
VKEAAARWTQAAVFSRGAGKEASREAEPSELCAKIGQLRVERDFYPGGPGDKPSRAVAMIDLGRGDLSVRRQCVLRGLARSGIYHWPAAPDLEKLALMRWIDEQHDAVPRLTTDDAELRRAGHQVTRKRVQRCNG